jgi:hypothetical protein
MQRIIPLTVAAMAVITLTTPSRAQDPLETVDSAQMTPAATGSDTVASPEHVARATFTHGVEEHEPVDQIDTVDVQSGQIYYFTEIVDLAGTTVTHRWLHDGKTMAEVPIEIGGPRWRVYSLKTLRPEQDGMWTAEVVAEDGTVLRRDSLTVEQRAAVSTEDAASQQGS